MEIRIRGIMRVESPMDMGSITGVMEVCLRGSLSLG